MQGQLSHDWRELQPGHTGKGTLFDMSCLRRPTLARTDVCDHVRSMYYTYVSGDAQSLAIQHDGQYRLPPHPGRDSEREWARSYKLAETGNNGWSVTLPALWSPGTSSDPTNSLLYAVLLSGKRGNLLLVHPGWLCKSIIIIIICMFLYVSNTSILKYCIVLTSTVPT